MDNKVNQKKFPEVIKHTSCFEPTTNFSFKLTIRTLLLLFFVVCLIGLTTCIRQINCPKFDEKILSWIPYQAGDVLELYSQLKDSTIIFSINSVTVEHITDYKPGFKCMGCESFININQDNHQDSNFRVYLYSNNNDVGSHNYWVLGSCFYTYSEFKNYTLENTNYDIVRIFDNEEQCSHGMLQKIILAKDIGVIGLIDIYDNLWTLKINVNEGRKRRNIDIINRSCQ